MPEAGLPGLTCTPVPLSPLPAVVLPGYGWAPGNSSVICPVGTYNPGYNSRTCSRCPGGLTTPTTGSNSSQACVAPAGEGGLDQPLRMPGSTAAHMPGSTAAHAWINRCAHAWINRCAHAWINRCAQTHRALHFSTFFLLCAPTLRRQGGLRNSPNMA